MARLSTDNGVFTVLVEFHTTPETQGEVLDTLIAGADLFPSQPGFVSQHFHRSHDGARVLCYVQWRSEADHLACYQSPDVAARGKAVNDLVESGKATMEVRTYDVAHGTEA